MIAAPTSAVAVVARMSWCARAIVVIATTSGSSVAQKKPSATRSRPAELAAVEEERRHAADDEEHRSEERQLGERAGARDEAFASKAIPLVTKKNGMRKP